MTRQQVLTGRPLESLYGYSRATRIGNRIEVAGTCATNPDGTPAGGDSAYEQAKVCLGIIRDAIEELGGRMDQVYRTRMFITRAKDAGEVGRAHGEVFGDVKPVSTMLVVAALLVPEWVVEIEAHAEID
jgi:enamine deaminase RidA (YjgF/YER057c/UK114 family)